ncbi:MAG: PadR family transcriptional regulator [Candidatus Micrarchaeia archaeon]
MENNTGYRRFENGYNNTEYNMYYNTARRQGGGNGAGMGMGRGSRGGHGMHNNSGFGMHRVWNMRDIGRGFIGIKYMILRIAREKEITGAQIMEMVDKLTMGCYRPSSGNTYPALNDLVSAGYLNLREENGVKYYRTTKKGNDLLDSISGPLFANRRRIIEDINSSINSSNNAASNNINEEIDALENKIKELRDSNLGSQNQNLINELEEIVKKLKSKK